MTKPRNILMPAGSMGTFHVVSRCVRREFLLDRDGRQGRLAGGLARWLPHVGLDLHASAVMSNHVHLVLRLRPDRVAGWDDATVARHALAVMPARTGLDRTVLPVSPEVVARYASQEAWVAQQRERLSTPSWLLRLMKQEMAMHANRQERCSGHFWEGRYHSTALLDLPAVLACMIYVDLNPVRAGIVSAPEQASWCSARHRAAQATGEPCDRAAADAALAAQLTPIADCAPVCPMTGAMQPNDLDARGYLLALDASGRQIVAGKRGHIPDGLAGILDRLGFTAEAWTAAMARGGAMLGAALGAPALRQAFAHRTGTRWCADTSGLWVA